MRQPRNLKVAKEVLDVWRLLRGSFVVVTRPSNRYDTISLLGCLILVSYPLNWGNCGIRDGSLSLLVTYQSVISDELASCITITGEVGIGSADNGVVLLN